jgi:hypothetical protein
MLDLVCSPVDFAGLQRQIAKPFADQINQTLARGKVHEGNQYRQFEDGRFSTPRCAIVQKEEVAACESVVRVPPRNSFL